MSNHGSNIDLSDFLKKKLERTEISLEKVMGLIAQEQNKLGATGRFPLGKLTPSDEGEIRFGIAADPQTKTIILNFGKPVAWLGLPRKEAAELAAMILEKLKEL